MKFPPAFKHELLNAIRLSAFITLLVFGVLYVQSRSGKDVAIGDRHTSSRQVASPARTNECFKGEDGHSYRYSRATPPYDKIRCD